MLAPSYTHLIKGDSFFVYEEFNNKIHIKRKLSDRERARYIRILSKRSFDSLAYEYINEGIDDGIQVEIELVKNNKKKKVFIANYYLQDIASLIHITNKGLSDTMTICYPKKIGKHLDLRSSAGVTIKNEPRDTTDSLLGE